MASEIHNRFNRMTGLVVLEVRHSNPNGDPDAESDPRTTDVDQFGIISPPSFKRKIRDLVENNDRLEWSEAARALGLNGDSVGYQILESRFRDRKAIFSLSPEEFTSRFWDARVFGNTFLEAMKDMKPTDQQKREKAHLIRTGAVQIGPGVSVAPVEIERLTTTNKSGVEEGKDRGMAPLGWRVVRHGVYTIPIFVNPSMAAKSGCTSKDIDVLKFLLPHAYRANASATRPAVDVLHVWWAEHKSPLGSCPDYRIIDRLTPRKPASPQEPSTSVNEYDIPDADALGDLRHQLEAFEDLCTREWH